MAPMDLSTLRRSTTEARVAGVCVALADRWRVDPLLVRLMTVLLALSGGIGLVLYAAAWLSVPRQGSDRAAIDQFIPGARRAPRTLWLLALAVAALLTAMAVGSLLPFGIGPAIVVGVVCYLGLQRSGRLGRRDRQAEVTEQPDDRTAIPPAPFSEQTRFTRAAYAWQTRVQEHLDRVGRSQPVDPADFPPAEPVRPSRPVEEPQDPTLGLPPQQDPGYSLEAFLAHPDPVGLYGPADPEPATEPVATKVAPTRPTRRDRRRARWRTLLLILLPVIGVTASDVWLNPPFHAYLAAALLGTGVALVFGAWRPRPRGLIALGLLLAVSTVGTAAGNQELTTEPTQIVYRSAADLPPGGTRADVGPMIVDLSEFRMNGDTSHTIAVDAGQLQVILPEDTTVRLQWSVDAGAATLPSGPQRGVDLKGSSTVQQGPPGSPTLTLDTHVDVGELEVRR
ncbi:hypothetical protein BI335_17195 [Enemella evansiae]|nr:hypothetical protein BI335_17195 [Enemella evansiae]